MKEIFNYDYIKKIHCTVGKDLPISISDNEVTIKIDWQSNFVIERSKDSGKYVFKLFYVERGNRINYANYSSSNALTESLLLYLKNINPDLQTGHRHGIIGKNERQF